MMMLLISSRTRGHGERRAACMSKWRLVIVLDALLDNCKLHMNGLGLHRKYVRTAESSLQTHPANPARHLEGLRQNLEQE